MRTQREVTLPLHLDASSGAPLVAQLVDAFRALLAEGALRPGEALPSTRALAVHLGLARGTVVAAFEQLAAEGWFEGQPGRATIVNPRLDDVHPDARDRPRAGAGASFRAPTRGVSERALGMPDEPRIDLRPGRPLDTGVVGPEWRAAWRRAADAPVDIAVDALGWPELRSAIAEHLRHRGVLCSPREVVVTAGGRDGLDLLLRASKVGSVGVEEPGYPSLRRAVARAGVRIVPLPADEHGLITADLPDAAPDLVIVTPSHQYPLGGSLPVDRRQQLLAWARAHGVLLLEDDYDSELRYTSAPLPTLTSLDADARVALLGTFSKTLTPTLAMGYLVVPPHLLDAVEQERHDWGQPVGLVPQRAVADFLASGALSRHTQRMRQLYRRRRGVVTAALAGLGGVRVYPMDGGLHCVVEHGRDEASVIDALAVQGIAVAALSEYWAGGGPRPGLVFGFGRVSDPDLHVALNAIRGVLGG